VDDKEYYYYVAELLLCKFITIISRGEEEQRYRRIE